MQKLIVVAVLTAIAAPRVAQPPAGDARFEPLAALIQDKMREYRIPGVALGIVANGVTTVRGFGVTSVEDPLPVTAHTVFPIASISKTFAATAMMRLVGQGGSARPGPVVPARLPRAGRGGQP